MRKPLQKLNESVLTIRAFPFVIWRHFLPQCAITWKLRVLLCFVPLLAGTLPNVAALPDEPSLIRLSLSATVSGAADDLECRLQIVNRGNESVHHLGWHVDFAGFRQDWVPPQGPLEPGRELLAVNPLRTPAPLTAGEYPLIVTMTYRDSSGYPFSAILATTVTNRLPAAAAPAPLRVRLYPPDSLKERGELRVLAVSEHPHPLTARIRLVVPDSLESPLEEQELRIPAESARSIRFPLVNQRGRAGSRLPLAAITTYELDSIPRCLVRSTAVDIPAHRGYLARHPLLWLTLATVLLLFFAACQWSRVANRMPRAIREGGRNGWILCLLILLFFTAHIPLDLLLRDTVTVGGDTPAHNVLASHLRDHWFSEGRLLTWSHVWWTGFPAFQYYFPLPYMLMAVFSLVLPFNIAFKLVSVLGVIFLPFSVWLAGRILKFPKSAASLMAVAMLPFLFTGAHVMWGVNLYSTLAGMIANSFSFALFPLCLACAWRDADSGRPRIHTTLLLAALMLSHFFTSVIAILTIAVIPFVGPRAGMRRAFSVLVRDGIPAAFLCAWWLIPLLAKYEYSVDFGSDWNVTLWGTLPWTVVPAAPAAAVALWFALQRSGAPIRPVLWMTALAAILFVLGTRLHPVFVNVRLWPFVYFGILILAAIGGGLLIERFHCPYPAILAIALYVGIMIDFTGSMVRSWAEWNLEGLEAKPLANEFRDLIEPLDGTPGRLAYDLNDANKAFGSSRIFEVIPHLIDKPILEGGLVNSALGALFAYTVQGEISQRGAGYPTIVPAAEYNPRLGLRHLELFNVRHLITPWETLQEFLTTSDAWHSAYRVDRWQVFSATGQDPGKIGVLDNIPPAVKTGDRQHAAVAWMQTPALLNQPFLWLAAHDPPPPGNGQMLTEEDYQALTEQAAVANTGSPELFSFDGTPVTIEEWSNHRIRFRTTAVGRPHLIKTSYFPNWQVSGSGTPYIYMVSPAFMLLIPDQTMVELVYGHTTADRLGHLATVAGILMLGVWMVVSWRNRGSAQT